MRRRTRRREENSPPRTCEHLAEADGADEPMPVTTSCAECDAGGSDAWAHLRMCLTCGHVGCCDSSPHQHAYAHHQQTGHPVMRSIEPGETWRWCYVDVELG